MSFNVNWDIEKYRDDHESEEHWQLRASFMNRWKNNYSEERLVCLARVFCNIEFMGCRYPAEVMKEVAQLSKEVAKEYRSRKKNKLQRTFVSASDAASDRAKGRKREAGNLVEPSPKTARIEFVRQGEKITETETNDQSDDELTVNYDNDTKNVDNDTKINDSGTKSSISEINNSVTKDDESVTKTDTENKNVTKEGSMGPEKYDLEKYMNEFRQMRCIDVGNFNEQMFQTQFGKMVLLIRPWGSKLWNVQASCQACHLPFEWKSDSHKCTLIINGKELAEAKGDSKQDAKNNAVAVAWDILIQQAISVIVKRQWIPQDGGRIGVGDVSGGGEDMFGTPVENTVATKMMKMMGWKGGGLGADAQGIAEPIQPHLQMVNRAGLGSCHASGLRNAAFALMRRYRASDSLDVDLVFSADFSKQERCELHRAARVSGLISTSYGKGEQERFLVVRKRVDPFSLVQLVIEKGGSTPKYQVFIPETIKRKKGR